MIFEKDFDQVVISSFQARPFVQLVPVHSGLSTVVQHTVQTKKETHTIVIVRKINNNNIFV